MKIYLNQNLNVICTSKLCRCEHFDETNGNGLSPIDKKPNKLTLSLSSLLNVGRLQNKIPSIKHIKNKIEFQHTQKKILLSNFGI